MLPKPIQILIDYFTKLPSVGPRQAARFVFHLLGQPKEDLANFALAISNLKNNLKKCSLCFRTMEEEEGTLCLICKNPKRDKSLICIVEKDTDIGPIEKTREYQGLYHILGRAIDPLNKKSVQMMHLKELTERVKKEKPKEIIIATSPTTEGSTTALYIERLFKPLNLKITRLGRGLSTGSELEYTDEETLSNALTNRK